jgi:hypothetical protein
VGLALVIGTLSFAAAGCGGGSGSGSSGGGSSGTSVNVTLKDYSISLGQSGSLAPGTYTFHVANQGPSAHNLTIDGPDVEDAATPTFSSGSKDLTVTLQSGKYEFYCSVPGHRQLGMETDVTVS